MTDDPIRRQAEDMADEWMADMRDRADLSITTLCDIEGVTITDHERQLVDLGVEAGMTAAMLVMRERGLIPGGPA